MQRIHLDRTLWTSALILLLIAGFGIAGAVSKLDKPFAGFLVLPNGVVASATVPGWPATEGGEIYQHRVVAIDEQALAPRPGEVDQRVGAAAPGTTFRFRFENPKDGTQFVREIESQVFSWKDAVLLYGVYLLNGIALAGAALFIRLRCAESSAARSTLPFLVIGAAWGLSAMDLYGPYRLFRIHVLCESLLAPAIIEMALGFPRPMFSQSRRREIVASLYILAACLGVSYQIGLYQPRVYVDYHLFATSLGGLALALFVLSQIWRWAASRVIEGARPPTIVFVGTIAALLLPVVLCTAESFTGGTMPQSSVGFSVFIFPISIAHAVAHGHLFGESYPRPSRAGEAGRIS